MGKKIVSLLVAITVAISILVSAFAFGALKLGTTPLTSPCSGLSYSSDGKSVYLTNGNPFSIQVSSIGTGSGANNFAYALGSGGPWTVGAGQEWNITTFHDMYLTQSAPYVWNAMVITDTVANQQVLACSQSVSLHITSTNPVSGNEGPPHPVSGSEGPIYSDFASFSSNTSVTLDLRNAGGATVTLVTYYVRDASGNAYELAGWSGPNIAPNSVVPTNFLIGSSCNGCTLIGNAFTFTPGTTFMVEAVTSRNHIFTYIYIFVAFTATH